VSQSVEGSRQLVSMRCYSTKFESSESVSESSVLRESSRAEQKKGETKMRKNRKKHFCHHEDS
jgi:hypothetical protein